MKSKKQMRAMKEKGKKMATVKKEKERKKNDACEERKKRKEEKERWGRNEMNGLETFTYIQRRVLNYKLPKLPL